jgi:3-dehydroquinate dehydratase II
MKIAIINGPNLNLLGERETELYGNVSFEEYINVLKAQFPDVELHYYQSNIEGELVTALQNFGFYAQADAIVLNAGGYSHTSVAIADAVIASKGPVVQVHITNIYSRETVRHTDLIASSAKGVICGFGLDGYRMAIDHVLKQQSANPAI